MKTVQYITLLILVFCTSCKSGKSSHEASVKNDKDSVKTFVLPEIPTMYTTPEQRGDFLVKHYWDNFNFTDTNCIHQPEITEQAWVDFLDVAKHVPLETAREGIDTLMARSGKEKKIFDYFTTLADNYLYDPNSPFRNEEFYIVVLQSMLASNQLSQTEKSRPKFRLELAQKNRLGTKALNFTYTLKSGKQGTLYNISSKYTLIFINNPGCHACGEITEGMKTSASIQHLLSEKELIILCIYPDEELDEWEKHLKDFPADWINGYDKGNIIKAQNLYDIKAIPSLYLLDKNKIVLLKDATLPDVENYLYMHQ